MKLIDAFLNSAAVWFTLKFVEVLPIAIYDVFAVINRLIASRGHAEKRDTSTHYDSRRGKLEYVTSGTGFLDPSLVRKSKKWLMISTLIPILVFVAEVSSIFLGFETRKCETSTDMKVISAPGLELFGEGPRHKNLDLLLQEVIGQLVRSCISWPSSNSGVNYYSTICGDTAVVPTFTFLIDEFFPRYRKIALKIRKHITANFEFSLFLSLLHESAFRGETLLGAMGFTSEVLVNSKRTLHRNVTGSFSFSENIMQEMREDLEYLEVGLGITRSEYFEDEYDFGFLWDNVKDFERGSILVCFVILGRATRGEIQPATEMSNRNNDAVYKEFDISCKDDFVLPRTVSIAIIVSGIVLRLLLIALPMSVSSAEFALVTSEEIANSQECAVFFMDRGRAVPRLRFSNDGITNHVGYTSLPGVGHNPNLPWRGKMA